MTRYKTTKTRHRRYH